MLISETCCNINYNFFPIENFWEHSNLLVCPSLVFCESENIFFYCIPGMIGMNLIQIKVIEKCQLILMLKGYRSRSLLLKIKGKIVSWLPVVTWLSLLLWKDGRYRKMNAFLLIFWSNVKVTVTEIETIETMVST